MLAPLCLTSLDRRKTNTKHTVEAEPPQSKDILRLILYQEHSLTLDMCKDHCTVVGLAMIHYAARTPLPKSATPIVPLHHFSRNTRKWAVIKSLSMRKNE